METCIMETRGAMKKAARLDGARLRLSALIRSYSAAIARGSPR